MGSLSAQLTANEVVIRDRLHIGYAIWDDLISRVERQEANPKHDFYDEQIWTFLVGCAYAFSDDGASRLAYNLIGEESSIRSAKIWFECLPNSPRMKEGNSRVDLAVGAIKLRPGTQSGVEFDSTAGDWIALCECKWYSDIDTKVSYDQHRNQLLRIIENAVCFQSGGVFPERAHVVLVTPASFKNRAIKSRLYQYKFEEYTTNPGIMIDELNACRLKPSSSSESLATRLSSIKLHWVTYQEVLQDARESSIREPLSEFIGVSDGSREHC